MRRFLPRVAAAIAFVVVAAVGAPATPSYAAVPVAKVGWWTKSPSPPSVPEGGLAVGEAPDGPLTLSAFEIDTGGGASGAKLQALEFDGQAAQAASVQVCTTSDGWAAASGADLALAPRAACPSPPVAFTRDSNGAWTADLASLLAGKTGRVSVMVLPGPDAAALPGGARSGAFQVSFQPPKVDGTAAPAPSPSSDESPAPVYDTPAATNYSYAIGGALVTPEVAAPSPSPSELVAAPPTGAANENVNFPVRVSGTPRGHGKSRVVILGWIVLAAAIGALAGAWHWARGEGVIERLLPFRSGGGLLAPPGD